jgi:hypothetical protein
MTRREFTAAITTLLREMIDAGDQPIIDYALRSQQEQQRLFIAGLSKCDGIDRMSKHQTGTAMDIYLVETVKQDGKPDMVRICFEWSADKARKWHDRWVQLGGKELIVWDLGHFEG